MANVVVARIVFNRIDELRGKARDRASEAVRKAAFDIEAGAKASMAGPKSGHMYGGHQASAPGEAPAIDLALLVNSIQTEMDGDVSAVVYTNAEYAPHLEYGTTKMAARPFLTPAAEAVRPSLVDAMKELFE